MMDEAIGCGSLLILIAVVILTVFVQAWHNKSVKEDWNDGICPKCEARYELVGIWSMSKYYACPECGKEVKRY